MPPLFTATNWTTFVRKAVHSARHSLSTRAIPVLPRLTRIQRASIALRHALQETYPCLHTQAYSLSRTQPLHAVSRGFATSRAAHHSQSPLAQAARTMNARPFRLQLHHPRGPAMVGQVGIPTNAARTFATTPAGANIANANVVLRAFVNLVNDDKTAGTLPISSKYDSYPTRRRHPRRCHQKLERRRLGLSCSTSSGFGSYGGSWMWGDAADRVDVARRHSIRNLEHFFPRQLRSPPPVPLPPLPETLVTPGSTTTLSLALSPSLNELLLPTTSITYAETEIGSSIFAGLLHGILPLHEAYSFHATTRVYPLLNKLASLGVLSTTDITPTTARLEIIPDADDRPDIMHVIFPSRSKADIQALLGETLDLPESQASMPWFALYEQKALTKAEDEAISEQWGTDRSRSSTRSADDERSTDWGIPLPIVQEISGDLILPQVDVGHSVISTSSAIDIDTPPEPFSWPVSEDISPLLSPTSNRSTSLTRLAETVTASLLSHLSDESMSTNEWSVPPHEADSDLESSVAMSDIMSVENEIWSVHSELVEEEAVPPSPSVEMSWSGRGEGFGFAQQY